jgi:glycosyltransferase involved in cell wall biosynthesis
MQEKPPLVSIGVPIKNCANRVEVLIHSLEAIEYKPLEIVVSVNKSEDSTLELCKKLIGKNKKFKLFAQERDIGAISNFEFTFNKAQGEYFLWNAGDDIRSPDCVTTAVEWLENNPDYIAVAPNSFFSTKDGLVPIHRFNLNGNRDQRVLEFMNHPRNSHAIYYSIFRRNMASNFVIREFGYNAADWNFSLRLVNAGRIATILPGNLILGTNGVSRKPNAVRIFKNSNFDSAIPFFRFSINALLYIRLGKKRNQYKFVMKILQLNFRQMYVDLYNFLFKRS